MFFAEIGLGCRGLKMENERICARSPLSRKRIPGARNSEVNVASRYSVD